MDRRLFLTGLLGLAGAATVAKAVGPVAAEAAVLNPGDGILDELAASEPEVTEVGHRRRHRRHRHGRRHGHGHRWHRHGHRRPRRHRRRVWRRVCRRVRHRGEWYRRCWRERVWIWI